MAEKPNTIAKFTIAELDQHRREAEQRWGEHLLPIALLGWANRVVEQLNEGRTGSAEELAKGVMELALPERRKSRRRNAFIMAIKNAFKARDAKKKAEKEKPLATRLEPKEAKHHLRLLLDD